MKLFLVLISIVLVGCSPPNFDELDQDISDATVRLQSIDAELAEYEGGLIHKLLLTRKHLTGATREMLEQKRSSLLYWIKLEYPIKGTVSTPASAETLEKILTEIRELESQVDTAEVEANNSGGLIAVVKKAEVATLKLSVATVKHRYYAEKYGVPVMFGSSEEETSDDRAIIDPTEL